MPALRARPEPIPAGAVDAALSVLTPYVRKPSDATQAAESVTEILHLIYEMHIQHYRKQLHDQMESNKSLIRTTAQINKQCERLRQENQRLIEDASFHYDLNRELSEEARRMHEELQRLSHTLDQQRAQTSVWKSRAKRAEKRIPA